jgi:D-tyrosyl-tRNA(Tyr) deacylase
MRAVVQRVSRASVVVEGEVVGKIARGLCVLVGVGKHDLEKDADQLADKLSGLRIFEDDAGKMNLSIVEAGGSLLCISQFTLFGDTRRGRRPSFGDAMEPETAKRLFERLCDGCRARGLTVETGRFRAHMDVELVNDGPVTLIVDTAAG